MRAAGKGSMKRSGDSTLTNKLPGILEDGPMFLVSTAKVITMVVEVGDKRACPPKSVGSCAVLVKAKVRALGTQGHSWGPPVVDVWAGTESTQALSQPRNGRREPSPQK